MDVSLTNMKWQFAIVCVDHFVIFLRSPNDHMGKIRQTMTLLHNTGVTFILDKCKLHSNDVHFLGQINFLGRFGVSTRPNDAVVGLQHLKTVTELRSFLGLGTDFVA